MAVLLLRVSESWLVACVLNVCGCILFHRCGWQKQGICVLQYFCQESVACFQCCFYRNSRGPIYFGAMFYVALQCMSSGRLLQLVDLLQSLGGSCFLLALSACVSASSFLEFRSVMVSSNKLSCFGTQKVCLVGVKFHGPEDVLGHIALCFVMLLWSQRIWL